MLWLLAGIAVTATAGYLVAALVFFPSPLLENERQVARVAGLTEDEATHELERQGLTAQVVAREAHPSLPQGRVIWQDPPSGVAVPRGTIIQLAVSSGTARVMMPDVVGYDTDLAQRLITAAGLRVELVDTLTTKGAASGTVGATMPVAGDSVAAGRGIVLHLVP